MLLKRVGRPPPAIAVLARDGDAKMFAAQMSRNGRLLMSKSRAWLAKKTIISGLTGGARRAYCQRTAPLGPLWWKENLSPPDRWASSPRENTHPPAEE